MDLREIDRLVAKHVMGHRSKAGDIATSVETHLNGAFIYNGALLNPWRPTEDIAAAWEVLEQLSDADLKQWDGRWTCTNVGDDLMCKFDDDESPAFLRGHWYGAIADTAPLAICLAALRTKGVKVPA